MKWWTGYLAATAAIAAIDGAFLGGVAAIITAFSTLILGILAYRKGQKTKEPASRELAAAWAIAEERAREVTRLRRQLARERRRVR